LSGAKETKGNGLTACSVGGEDWASRRLEAEGSKIQDVEIVTSVVEVDWELKSKDSSLTNRRTCVVDIKVGG
jgi:hypothetical protein